MLDSGSNARGEVWRLLDYSDPSPYLNMALEEAILCAVGAGRAPCTLRVWQNENAVIVGRYQDTWSEVNQDVCEELGTAVIRRIGGGGAVFQDGGNLNFALSLPLTDPRARLDVLESYRLFAGGLIAALAELGLEGHFAPVNDVDVDGRKISGAAQARHSGGLRHGGTLLLRMDVEKMARLLRPSREYLERKAVASVQRRVVTLEQLGRPCSPAEAKAALVRGFEKTLGVRFVPGEVTLWEWELAHHLLRDRYGRDEWNLGGPGGASDREDKRHLG